MTGIASPELPKLQDACERTTILKRRGRVVLVETGNPVMGIGYSVRIGSLGVWSGDKLTEAECQFEQATQ